MKFAGVAKLVDAADSKSVDGNIVWVQVPLPVQSINYNKLLTSYPQLYKIISI